MAPLDQFGQDPPGVTRLQKRPVAAPRYPLHQDVEIGAQPQRYPVPTDHGAGQGIHKGAAAGGQDLHRLGQKPGDDSTFAVAKDALAAIGKNLLDRLAGGGFDLLIRIEKRQAEPQREAAPDLGFAGAHQPDQNDGPARDKAPEHQGLPVKFERVSLQLGHLREYRSFSRHSPTVLAYGAAGSSIAALGRGRPIRPIVWPGTGERGWGS